MTIRYRYSLIFTTLFISLFLVSVTQVFSQLYDNFSSGNIDTSIWIESDPNNLLSVRSGSLEGIPQSYVLKISGGGNNSYNDGWIAPSIPLNLSSGAGINFFNFSDPTYSYSATDQHFPAVYLSVGPTNNFYAIAMGKGPTINNSNDWIGVRHYVNGTLDPTSAYNVPYSGSSGGLITIYNNNNLSFGYSNTTNQVDWKSNYTPLYTYKNVNLGGNPQIRVGTQMGARGNLSADVGGLYVGSYQKPQPKIYGLFIGIYDDSAENPLNGDIMARQLRDKFKLLPTYGDSKLLVGNNRDLSISLESIRDAITQIKNEMNTGDQFFLSITGHGNSIPDGPLKGDEYISLGKDYQSYLLDKALTIYLKDMNSFDKWIFLDACHSGGFWANSNSDDAGNLETLEKIALMSSAPEDGLMWYANDGMPYFGKALLEAFDKKIYSFDELKTWMSDQARIDPYNLHPIVYEGSFGDSHVFTNDMWNPEFFKTEDFTGNFNSTVPEPTTMLLLSLGLVGIAGFRKRID